jgi:pimeloyl-ACP methyl ester carboxylesterase
MKWLTRGCVVFVLALSGCGAAGDSGTDDSRSPTSTESEDPTASLLERCSVMIPSGAPVRQLTLGQQSLAVFEAAHTSKPASQTVMVLLHQIGRPGLCGWGPFATQAAKQGLSSVALDMCGYGDSMCPLEEDPTEQVKAAIDYARHQLRARRVVLVGASMGGSCTVIAAAGGAKVDGWVDVSGPGEWDNVVLQDVAGELPKPGMVVFARSDGAAEYAAAKRLAASAKARFVDGGSGHGYELLTDVDGKLLPGGRAVLAFVEALKA